MVTTHLIPTWGLYILKMKNKCFVTLCLYNACNHDYVYWNEPIWLFVKRNYLLFNLLGIKLHQLQHRYGDIGEQDTKLRQ